MKFARASPDLKIPLMNILQSVWAAGWAAPGEAVFELREPALEGLLHASLSVSFKDPAVWKIAVEPEGPARFTGTEPRRPLGSTLLRRRLLRLAGWEVVSVPFFEWDRLFGDEEKADYLGRRIFMSGSKRPQEEDGEDGGGKFL